MSDVVAINHHQYVLNAFRTAFNVLSTASDLSPYNNAVNTSLIAFVRAVLDCECNHDCALLEQSDVLSMRRPMLQKLAEAEFEMEKFYADLSNLPNFPYHQNYRDLVTEEVLALKAMGHDLENPIYFIGSGPLPLTAIELALQTGQKVICVEKDPEAARLSRAVIRAYGLGDRVHVLDADGASINYEGSGLVMIAALTEGKDDILERIRQTAPDALLGIRSAEGLRTLLYEEIDQNHVARHGYVFGGKSLTNNHIINTTLLFRPAFP